MTKKIFFIGFLLLFCSCNISSSRKNHTDNVNIDSSKFVFKAAFKICSLKYEKQDAQSAFFGYSILKDTLNADLIKRRIKNIEELYFKSVEEFVALTNFGAKNIYHIEDYTNFIRIQYLQTHFQKRYLANHKAEVLNISRERHRSIKQFNNPLDTSQAFFLLNLTMKVLSSIGVDTNYIDYSTLKNANILVQSFGDFVDPDYFPCFLQDNTYNCGPACLKTIADHYNLYYSIRKIEKLASADTAGTTFSQLAIAAEKMGFDAKYNRVSFEELYDFQLPTIVHWNDNHFVVVYEFTEDKVKIANPANGAAHITYETFWDHWLVENGRAVTTGHVLQINGKKTIANNK